MQRAVIRRSLYIVISLILAATIGVMVGTGAPCGLGLLTEERQYCGVFYFWILGIPLASLAALILGFPLQALFTYFKLNRWWHYLTAGAAVAACTLLLSYTTGASWPFSNWLAFTQTASIPVVAALSYEFILGQLTGPHQSAA